MRKNSSEMHPSQKPLETLRASCDYWERLVQKLQSKDININVAPLGIDQINLRCNLLRSFCGNTPVVQYPNSRATILRKDLSTQLTECHYDLAMIDTLQWLIKIGVLRPEKDLVIENSSGSMGISLGAVGKLLGVKIKLLIPKELEDERVLPMRVLGKGVEIVRTPIGYVRASSKYMVSLMKKYEDQGFTKLQFDREHNRPIVYQKDDERIIFLNHSANKITVDSFAVAGKEIAQYCQRHKNKPDFIVMVTGNFTTILGIGGILKNRFPNVQIVGIEDRANPNHFTHFYPGKYEKIFEETPNFKPTSVYGSSQKGVPLRFEKQGRKLVDEMILFNSTEVVSFQEKFNYEQQPENTIGRSSAASLLVAEQIAQENPDSNIWVLIYDKGDRYKKKQ